MSKQNELVELARTGASGGGSKNLIINGAMNLAQRGAARTVSDGSNEGYQTLDRFAFYFSNSAGGVCTISQDSTVPSGQGFSSSYKVDVATADTSIDPTHSIIIQHSVEAQNLRNSGWDYTSATSYITLSFWARSTKAGIYNVVFRADDVGHKYYPVEYTLVANTWKKVTVTVAGDASLVINNDAGSGLDIRWNLQSGSSRNQGTADQWNAIDATKQGTSNQVNFFDNTSNNFYLTGVQLEVGEKATDFEHRSYADELAKAQRYYYKLPISSYGPYLCQYVSTNRFSHFWHPVPMRAVPTSTTTMSSGTVTEFSPDTHHTKYYNAANYNSGTTYSHTAYEADAEL